VSAWFIFPEKRIMAIAAVIVIVYFDLRHPDVKKENWQCLGGFA
jgi:hypothetical protein